jgi:membrane associated rhomboid family serine protease
VAAAVREALDEAGIPYHWGVAAGQRPGAVFSVPEDRLAEAHAAVQAWLAGRPELDPAAQRFPLRPLLLSGALVALHFLIVLWSMIEPGPGQALYRRLTLLAGGTLEQPWRLLTYTFLHTDLRHAFWNGAALLAYAVALLTALGRLETAVIYLASGVGGGVVALAFAYPGTQILGSSGAVAGLFGAWLVLTLRRARLAPLGRRARLRVLGIALLVIPPLLTPTTPTGQRVSVESHLGGLATGVLIGAVLSRSARLTSLYSTD